MQYTFVDLCESEFRIQNEIPIESQYLNRNAPMIKKQEKKNIDNMLILITLV